jgi:hypothetical protein
MIYDQMWNEYNTYYQSYEQYNNRFHMIGLIASIIIVLLIDLNNGCYWFYIPMMPLIIPMSYTIRNLCYGMKDGSIKKIEIPNIGRDKLMEILNYNKNTDFYKEVIDDIHLATVSLYDYKTNFARPGIRTSICWIIISFITTMIIVFYSAFYPAVLECG